MACSIKHWDGNISKTDKNEIPITQQTRKGLIVQSILLLETVVSSSKSVRYFLTERFSQDLLEIILEDKLHLGSSKVKVLLLKRWI